MEKTYYIKFEGYCETTLGIVKVNASSYEEAKRKAIEEWLSDIDISETDEDEYEEYNEDEENDNMDFDDAMDILDELELDDTAYDYYREALEGIHYNDQASHETHGYKSLSDVIADARRCEEINANDDDDEEDLEEEEE